MSLDVDETTADEHRGRNLDRTRRDVLPSASLAPGTHNAQPWAARVLASDHALLRVDPRRRLQAVDPDGRELLVSIGAFLKNLVLAAGARGRAVEYGVLATTLAIHPMPQVLEEFPVARELGARLGTRDPVQFVLRVGYVGGYPEPVPAGPVVRARR